jgi:hypothetical protein
LATVFFFAAVCFAFARFTTASRASVSINRSARGQPGHPAAGPRYGRWHCTAGAAGVQTVTSRGEA